MQANKSFQKAFEDVKIFNFRFALNFFLLLKAFFGSFFDILKVLLNFDMFFVMSSVLRLESFSLLRLEKALWYRNLFTIKSLSS